MIGIWITATVETRNGKMAGITKNGQKHLIGNVGSQLRSADDTGFV